MTKRCRKSILCRPRRGIYCLGGAGFVVLHFKHLKIALSSAKALRGVSTNSQRPLFESGPPSLLHEGRAPNPQVLHCLILLATESALRRLLSSDQRVPAAEGRVVVSLEERDSHSPLVTAHPSSSSRFLVQSLVFSEEIVARDPQNLHGLALLSQWLQVAPQFSQSYKGLTVGDQSNATSILPSSQLPRHLLCRHGARSPPQKSCIWQPQWPLTSTAGLLSSPPPQQPLPSSAPRTHSRQRYTLIISTAFG